MQAVHVLVCTVELVLSHFPESLLGPPFYDSHCSHQKNLLHTVERRHTSQLHTSSFDHHLFILYLYKGDSAKIPLLLYFAV